LQAAALQQRREHNIRKLRRRKERKVNMVATCIPRLVDYGMRMQG
jgi:hypothetical protein